MVEHRLSVAVVTRNRPESLERTLRSLRMQCTAPFEVIVSDDSDDIHAQENRRLCELYSCDYQLGPRRGLYANRNSVARACSGSHIRTMDDDHEFPAEHMKHCLTAINSDPASVWVIGEFNAMERLNSSTVPPCPGELHPRGFSQAPINPDTCRSASCGASIYPRAVIDRGVMNREHFKFGALYLEYGCRLARCGFRIRHLSGTYVIHHFDSNARSFQRDVEYEAAMIYSMLSMSFRHQPTLKNRILTSLEILRRTIRSPKLELRAFSAARRALAQDAV